MMQPMAISDGGADAELLGPQHGGDDHVAAGADAAVGAQPHLAGAGCSGSAPGGPRTGPISQGQPAYLIEVWGEAPVPPTWPAIRMTSALALATPAATAPMPVMRDQLHADPRVGVDLLQVVDELGQVLDRIDVVVRRRRDQRHAGRGVAHPGDQLGDLEAGQLAALAGLGALGDLDLDLAALVQVFGGDAEAARGDLLDRRVGVVAVGAGLVALRVLAALAGDRAGRRCGSWRCSACSCASGDSAPRRHARRDEALADLVDALDLVERRRRAGRCGSPAGRAAGSAAARAWPSEKALKRRSRRVSQASCSRWISSRLEGVRLARARATL